MWRRFSNLRSRRQAALDLVQVPGVRETAIRPSARSADWRVCATLAPHASRTAEHRPDRPRFTISGSRISPFFSTEVPRGNRAQHRRRGGRAVPQASAELLLDCLVGSVLHPSLAIPGPVHSPLYENRPPHQGQRAPGYRLPVTGCRAHPAWTTGTAAGVMLSGGHLAAKHLHLTGCSRRWRSFGAKGAAPQDDIASALGLGPRSRRIASPLGRRPWDCGVRIAECGVACPGRAVAGSTRRSGAVRWTLRLSSGQALDVGLSRKKCPVAPKRDTRNAEDAYNPNEERRTQNVERRRTARADRCPSLSVVLCGLCGLCDLCGECL